MSASDKKFLLELPLKVILTEDGASNFISHNKKLLRFRLADNLDEYGISLNKFSPQSIQSMILLDYISKIEISMSEFVSSRQEVMDLSKVIVYSLLYKQFDREVYNALIQCECVKKHNRANPAKLIDNKKIQRIVNVISLIVEIVSILFFAISRQTYLTAIIFIILIIKIVVIIKNISNKKDML